MACRRNMTGLDIHSEHKEHASMHATSMQASQIRGLGLLSACGHHELRPCTASALMQPFEGWAAQTRQCAAIQQHTDSQISPELSSRQSAASLSQYRQTFGKEVTGTSVGPAWEAAVQKKVMHANGLKTCLVIEQAVAEGDDAAATWLQHSIYLRKDLLRLHNNAHASLSTYASTDT